MGLFSRIVHHGKIIGTDVADPETGGLLTVLLPTTLWGDPIRLTLKQAKDFAKTYEDIGWDSLALQIPSMNQLSAVFESSARSALPVDDYQSCEIVYAGKSKIEMNRALSFSTGRDVVSAPKATCATILVFS